MSRWIAAACAALAISGGARAYAEPAWTPLFDGQTLNGWTAKIVGHPAGENWRDTFVAADGVIRVSYAGYERFQNRFGHLFYKAPFEAYRLRLQYRVLEPPLPDTPGWAIGNSGIMFHSQSPNSMALGQAFPVSIEFQILGAQGSAPRPTGALCTPGIVVTLPDGKRQPAHCTPSATAPTIPNGTWVDLELEVLPDGHITQKINGQVVHRYSAPALDPDDPLAAADARKVIADRGGKREITGGYIALQSEGHPIEFRDIKVQRLQ
ncbi:MAG: DUF1080 domain-containing protein [Phenylobacterium sp.]|nr:DUF1080 domain-containing protein [Phenylobacterium sp.]